jgi:hypothetical protein
MQNHFYDFITLQDTQWGSLSWYMYLDHVNTLIGVYITGVQKEVMSTPCTKWVELPFPACITLRSL